MRSRWLWSLFVFLFIPLSLYAAPVPTDYVGVVQLPETGQTSCYKSAPGDHICDAGTVGQDAAVKAGAAWPMTRFTNNGNGTVTDNLTGLVWLRDARCIAPLGGITKKNPDVYDKLMWSEAIQWSNALASGSCDLTDGSAAGSWRLPNINELASLINREVSDNKIWLTIDGIFKFDNEDYVFASSTVKAATTSDPPVGTHFWYADLKSGIIYSKQGGNFNVLPVRDKLPTETVIATIQLPRTGQIVKYQDGDDADQSKGVSWPYPRFKNNNGDGTITDNLTGLTWLRDAKCGGTNNIKNWEEAITWANSLNHGDCNLNDQSQPGNWRLPNIKELQSIINYGLIPSDKNYIWLNNPDSPTWETDSEVLGFLNTDGNQYWSSTTIASAINNAWIIHNTNGWQKSWSKTYNAYVWPVKGGRHSALSIVKAGAGDGNIVDITDINDPKSAKKSYPEDSVVILSALPHPGFTFSGWSGGGCSGNELCIVTLGANTSVTATFDINQYTVTPSAGANGSLDPATPQTVLHNDIVSFEVLPDPGYRIDTVSGCPGTLSGNTYTTAPVTSDCPVTATFAPLPVTVLYPNELVSLSEGTLIPITWTLSGGAAYYNLSYSLDNGTTWTAITQIDGSTTSHYWALPQVSADQTQCKVRVTALDGNQQQLNADDSDTFAITDVPVVVTSPNGGEIISEGNTIAITWNPAFGAAYYNLKYSLDNGTTWIFIRQVSGSTTTSNWTLPQVSTDQTQCLVRVTALDSNQLFFQGDNSDSNFTIVNTPEPVTVLSPNGGESLAEGATVSISWTQATGAAYYNLKYSFDNGVTWTFIRQVSGSTTTSDWTLPQVSTNQTQCVVRVSALDNNQQLLNQDNSDSAFTIVNVVPVTVLSPNGGESFQEGTTISISWSPATDAAYYTPRYSLDNGATWTILPQVSGDITTSNWTLPNVTVDKNACLVKVNALNSSMQFLNSDTSDSNFSILSN